MKILNTLCSVLFIIIAITLHAQTAPGTTNTPHCEIEQATKMAFDTYPDLQAKSAANLKAFHKKIQNYKTGNVLIDNKVPVVFHLITPCENNFDFTKAFLEDVLTEVNADFTAQNTDEYNATIDPIFYTDQADIGITFKLAEIDPNGNPTDGITRSNSFYSNDGSSFQVPLKDIIQWNPSRYMNVWIVANVATSGYAQYPWTAETYPNLDGIVMSYDYVGENNIWNRPHILTHEIGHWLGLLHTWGDFTTVGSCADPAPTYCDCDDFIADTPNCLGYNSISCPSNLPNSCTDPSNDRPDNIFNFMDYACEVMFTNDQKTRMLQVISAGTADRDLAVTSDTDPTVFMAINSDNGDAKLYLDQLVYTESFSNPGTIQEIGVIELRDCIGCSFSANIGTSFTTTGLPTNIQSGLQITYLNSTQASISFSMTLTNAADHEAAGDLIFDLNFNANAINGINNTTQVFNEASIKGLKIDFIDNETGLQSNDFATASGYPVLELLPDDFEAAYVPHINDYVGFYHYQGGFYMYTQSGLQMEAAVTGSGSYDVKRLANGESLNTQVYQPITSGIYEGSNELVVYDAGSYTDWLNQTGFVGVRITTFCNEVYYVWIRIEVTNNELSLIDLVINTEDNGQLNAGESPDCVPEGDNTSFLFLNSVNINQINNVSGDNGGYQFFSNYTTDLIEGTTYTVDCQGGFGSATQYDGEWRVYIDLDADGSYSDPGELRYIVNQQTSINAGVELVPTGTLSGTSLNTTMMVIFSLYPLNGLCENYQYGETEEYNVTLKTSTTNNCPTDETISTTFNSGDVQLFEVSDWIYATSIVRSGADITFNAASYVQLNNGFSAETGADFTADIEGCNGGGNGCVPTVPTLADIDQTSVSVYCDYAYGYCNNHPDDNKEFELTNLATGAVVSYFSTDYFIYFPNLTESTNYQYRVRKQCDTMGVFGGWSPYFAFTTIPCAGGCVPTVPTLADIDQTPTSVYCDYAYGYCNNHPDDNKEFELTNLATGAVVSYFSTTHFAYFPNLTPSTNYQYRVRKQCGTAGVFGGWSPYFNFTTTACLDSAADGN